MRKLALTILAFMAGSSAFAASSLDLEKRLREQYPATRITSVRESPAKGIYEVVMGRNVAYTDEAGRYMVFGHLYDMKEQKDLTAELEDPETYHKPGRAVAVNRELHYVIDDLTRAAQEWEQAASKLEKLG